MTVLRPELGAVVGTRHVAIREARKLLDPGSPKQVVFADARQTPH